MDALGYAPWRSRAARRRADERVVGVDTEVVRRHALRVQQVADDIATAQSAAGTTNLHGGAFGVLCSFLPLFVSSVDQAAREALDAVKLATDATVTGLGNMAREFEATDDRVVASMQQAGKKLAR